MMAKPWTKPIGLLGTVFVSLLAIIEFAEERWEIRVSRACEAYLGGASLEICRATVGQPTTPREPLPERPAPPPRPPPPPPTSPIAPQSRPPPPLRVL